MQGRSERILVVGAGLTGAAMAYVASGSANVTVASSHRPATQATALSAGVVHGVGPPGALAAWTSLDARMLERLSRRARRGAKMLEDVLLNATKPVGLKHFPHHMLCGERGGEELVPLVEKLRKAKFEIEYAETDGTPLLIRRDDAVLHPRRLTIELLRQARERGADLRLREQVREIRDPASDQPLLVVFSNGSAETYDRVLWAGGWPLSLALEKVLDIASSRFARRIVLQQAVSAGQRPLNWILSCSTGQMTLSPGARCRHHTMVRIASEPTSGGLTWPEPPVAWKALRGPASRQRLAESVMGPLDRSFDGKSRVIPMTGFGSWPIGSVFGACLELLAEPSSA